MTNLDSHAQLPFLAEIEMQEWFVTPGKSTYIPVRLTNEETTQKILNLSVHGIPSHWMEGVPDTVILLPREHKEIALVIQPPDAPLTQTGRYPLRVTVTQAGNGHEQLLLEGTLTVAAYEVQGRVAILMDALHYTVAPGSAVTVSFKLINQGLEDDTFRLIVEGIPAGWVSTATPNLHLRPGEQKSVSLLIRPTHHAQSRAGRHPFKLQIESHLNPAETAFVECILTLDAFSDFKSVLKPARVLVGETVQVVIENVGNIPDSYTLAWSSSNPSLVFEWVDDLPTENPPQLDEEGIVKIRLLPGETQALNFRPKLHTRPIMGDLVSPFKMDLTAADGVAQTHTGDVVSKGLIPVWIVQVGLLTLFTMVCLASFFFARGNFAASGATETALANLAGLTQTAEVSAIQTAGATQTASANMTQAADAGQQDADGDGLTNEQELSLGTDPLVADTDGDGLLDGPEITAATNPLNPDTDGDALPDGDEIARGTDPLNQDTDADALADGNEIQLGTDPLNPDSDSDGILDGSETPPCPNPLNPDSDTDGFIDGQDLDPCDPNNPLLTATAISVLPTETPIPPAETPTVPPPTETPTGTLEPTATSQPPAPPLQGVLALISTRDGNPEIYTLNLADNRITRLTIDPAVEAQPAWSPDGRQLAFATNRDGNFEVYLMNADGTGLINLTNHTSDDFDPSWSQDGTQIAFVSNRDGNNEIYLMNADGTDPFNVTNHPAEDTQPTWFVEAGLIPTVRIAFTTTRDGNQEIYSTNPSGLDPKNLSNNSAEDHSPATMINDGLIAFVTNRDGNQEIYAMLSDGTEQTNITNTLSEDWSPAWIPSTEWIAFTTNRDGNQEIYVIKGSESYNLTANPADDYDPG